jgi:hypothetical protein
MATLNRVLKDYQERIWVHVLHDQQFFDAGHKLPRDYVPRAVEWIDYERLRHLVPLSLIISHYGLDAELKRLHQQGKVAITSEQVEGRGGRAAGVQ